MSGIPLIDIKPCIDGTDPQAMRKVAHALRDACEHTGFFGVTGHGVPGAEIEALQSAAYEFFDRPYDEKMRVKRPRSDQNRGYIATGDETLARLAGNETPPDLKEIYAIGPFDHPGDAYHTGPESYPSFAPNLWPDAPATLRPAMQAYWRSIERLAKSIARGFALSLDLAPDHFEALIDRNTSQLRLMHYPAPTTPPVPGQLRAGAHTDLGMMTILTSDNDIGGLQVKPRGGDWTDVPLFDDAFVINIGDLMMRWSNNRWVSTPHRVVNPAQPDGQGLPTSRRLSIGYFFIPNYDTEIACLPGCASEDRPARYEPITVQNYRTARFASTAGDQAAR
ncbi:MAG: 2-oxoglutarate and iron-dependent oxygenase domain-containing protein [Thalassobaculaceae bacterium]|nr:2-oxoglutarate and iron-dependent oxygenase domain-containing protein [Thalassobaculaceae bacterium]